MIEYSLKALTADELSFKVNPIKAAPDTKFEIKPMFTRQIRQANENNKVNIVILECKIESTEESPKPFNLKARFVGVFEVNNMTTDEDKRTFAINATETMFPYLRAAVTNLTADALINPLTLPVVPGSTLFPEDRGPNHYTLNFDPKVVN
ncbi:MAG TPA: protein-export chaperone SecB [Candidatus Gallimonas gallistercoris]|uniref:Protein-export chaperone SecB n=1 Tax=Candidatus Gallimonas gallistercoris TaxID=2838602 RepID=A0A9D2H2R1_9FIRM|nr:protein-export chaperone SecB [Candidatus Gallimonas gallistercoris]